jgi:hypothetical protein
MTCSCSQLYEISNFVIHEDAPMGKLKEVGKSILEDVHCT